MASLTPQKKAEIRTKITDKVSRTFLDTEFIRRRRASVANTLQLDGPQFQQPDVDTYFPGILTGHKKGSVQRASASEDRDKRVIACDVTMLEERGLITSETVNGQVQKKADFDRITDMIIVFGEPYEIVDIQNRGYLGQYTIVKFEIRRRIDSSTQ